MELGSFKAAGSVQVNGWLVLALVVLVAILLKVLL